MKTYTVKEIFYSIQGEGVRAGIPHTFVRFTGCNLNCRKDTHGFDCDTDFIGGPRYGLAALMAEIERVAGIPGAEPYSRTEQHLCVVLTGGEPMLQVDQTLVAALHQAGFFVAIETNGTREVPDAVDWITVSPKVDGEELRQHRADEAKYVRCHGQPLPVGPILADHYLISPAFSGPKQDEVARRDLDWCIELVKRNPEWRLSVQQHKAWRVR